MPSPTIQNLPAYSFANATLHIRKDGTHFRITGWPEPSAQRKRNSVESWQNFHPEFRLVRPYRGKKAPPKKKEESTQLCFDFHEESCQTAPFTQLSGTKQRTRAFDGFRFSLPKEIARILEPYRTHQWLLLLLLRYDPGAIDLAVANPALAFFLAQKMNGDRGLIEALQCSNMRQRDVLEVLGFEGTNTAVKLFRKISPSSITGDNWEAMMRLLRNELNEPKSPLHHVSGINSGVMEIMLDPAASRAATPSLLSEVAKDRSENYRGRVVHMITSTLRMQEELRNGKQYAQFSSVEKLRDVHDQVSENFRRRIRQLIDANTHESNVFRNPPISGIPGKIEPITSPEDLVNEGEEQGNCVASYASKVREGNTFIYRVYKPERATLSIVRNQSNADWEIGELETKFNIEVSDDTESYVQAWIERHRAVV